MFTGLFVEAIGCEIVHFFRVNRQRDLLHNYSSLVSVLTE